MAGNQYSLSFTTGGVLITESIAIAGLKLELGDWTAVRSLVLKQNTLQERTESTLKKLFGEISRRLKNLTNDELMLLKSGTEEEQKNKRRKTSQHSCFFLTSYLLPRDL